VPNCAAVATHGDGEVGGQTMGAPDDAGDDVIASSRPTGTLKVVLLSMVALLGFYLAVTEEAGQWIYLTLSLTVSVLALLLLRARFRHYRTG